MIARNWRGPGRVNLIGEHTDYNLGFVLPIALDLACFVSAKPNFDGLLRVHSGNENDSAEWPIGELGSLRKRQHWSDYIAGVAQQLSLSGVPVEAADLSIHSTVPVGAGLSSSAALEVSVALALGGGVLNGVELAKLCRRAETEFVGMPCGIMDQFVSVFGQENAAIWIDCRSLEHRAVPLPTDLKIVAINSLVKHELGSSAYRQRVAECAEASKMLGVDSLRDVDVLGVIDESSLPLRRARHVVTENQRVLQFVEAATAGDLAGMGRLFFASHKSMRDDYEISCEEIDYLVDTARNLPGVYGARMTGGGFGGCTVNLVAPGDAEAFRTSMSAAYRGRFGLDPIFYDCHAAAGAGSF